MAKNYEERVNDAVSTLDALKEYANGVTGQADISIGDVIKTLCDGYGQGSGGNVVTGTITLNAPSTTITIPVNQHNGNFIIQCLKDVPTYEQDGTNGFLVMMSAEVQPMSGYVFAASNAVNFLRYSVHTVFESRTTFVGYNTPYTNNSAMGTSFAINANGIKIPVRNQSYPFFAGTYNYTIIYL